MCFQTDSILYQVRQYTQLIQSFIRFTSTLN